MPTAKEGILFMKKLAKCSAATTISASGRTAARRSRHAAVGGVEFLRDARIDEVRPTRDAGRVARDSREHQAHTPATFSSIAVVM